MSEQQEQQQQPQQQQQQQQLKAVKDANNSHSNGGKHSGSSSSPPRKSNIHEMRNQDYVSRLMAATPPYLYSAPVGPNNFFFSDMLRSLVQARNNENARQLQLQQTVLARRPRKRSWSQHRPYYEQLRERRDAEEKQQQQLNATAAAMNAEKPLELTNKPYFYHLAHKYRKLDETVKELSANKLCNREEKSAELDQRTPTNNEVTGGAVDTVLQDTPPAASLPPQDLVLPPPPPVWYPPLYPPYGIDPLHFFIDLRVSGHIYDRKKENVSPLTSAENSNPAECENTNSALSLPNKHRHGSAFTVPVPRSNEVKPSNQLPNDAINLSSSKFENCAKYYDLGESKENHPSLIAAKSSANYMLQQLPRLYSHFAARDLTGSAGDTNNSSNSNNNFDADNKSDGDCDADSDGRISEENCTSGSNNRERDRDIDVEIIDSIKYRTDGESSRCSSPDEGSVTQID